LLQVLSAEERHHRQQAGGLVVQVEGVEARKKILVLKKG
jgi:hypothetical protein